MMRQQRRSVRRGICLACLFWLGSGSLPATVRLNEVMVRPLPDAAGGEDWGRAEYVELRNDGDFSVDLAGWRLAKPDATQAFNVDPEYPSPDGMRLAPGRLALILPQGGIGALARLAASGLPGECLVLRLSGARFLGNGLADASGTISLLDPEGRAVSSFQWKTQAEKGVSWERGDRNAHGSDGSWLPNRLGGTPGYANLVDPLDGHDGGGRRIPLWLVSRLVRAGMPGMIRIQLRENETASLRLFLPDGTLRRSLLEGFRTPGETSLALDGFDDSGQPLPAGLYLLVMTLGDRVAAVRALVIEDSSLEGAW